MRDFFKRVEEDGSEIYIESDMSAYGYSERYSWLFSVFIKFDASKNSQESFEEFLETKEALIIAVEHDGGAKYVGSRVVDGWNELYFYAENAKSLNAVVSKMLSNSGYVYESSVVKDTKWNFHYKNLIPSALESAHIQSEKIIFMLQEEEDDLEVPRLVEHYVSFTTPTQKEKFLELLPFEDFSFKDEISSEDFENGLALVKEHAVTEEEVHKNVEQLFEALKTEQGFYEGWSTTLVDGDKSE
ncbi:DUF695 domain-containing protein [Sulfurimonas sp.]|uniref:DUF695 domain-containing protein n=1 Tax=Sulfurimonas sp. TaxID=2022749 RepID=UPI00260E10D4|nr:DUF695 domain-containing protein [Sulfurimonas sp.]